MKIKILIVLSIISLNLYINTTYSFEPEKNISWINKCFYKVSWKKSDNSNFLKDRTETPCNQTLKFEDLWIPDWTYSLELKSDDNTISSKWTTTTYSDSSWASKSNKYWIQTFWTYKLDTKSPTCLLKEIRFLAWQSNNQYYNNWKLYYKSTAPASWKFEIVIESDDTENWTKLNTSKIEKIEFPQILWAKPNTKSFTTNNWKVEVIWRYEWSWNNNDNFDILNNTSKKFCFDNAWNNVPLTSDSNTKVIFEYWDWNYTITWINSLILTPDSESPKVESSNYNVTSNWFKYISWNDWNWNETSIYWTSTNDSKFFAALDNRKILIPKFKDLWSWLKTFKVNIENSWNKSQKTEYKKELSTKDTKVDDLIQNEIQHDFSLVDQYINNNWFREYDWIINTLSMWWDEIEEDKICDMVWNCVSTPTPNFKVIANTPRISTNNCYGSSWFWTKHQLNKSCKTYEWNSSNMIANMQDTHTTLVEFEDQFWNAIVPVSWVKELKLNINFENTLWCDQLNDASSWNCVDFMIKNWPTTILNWSSNPDAWERKNFAYVLSNYWQFSNWGYLWKLQIEMKSWVPTKKEYLFLWTQNSLYWNLSAELKIKNVNLKVDYKTPYTWVWENNQALELANSEDNKPNYKWTSMINFSYIDNIYPLIEWQEKELKISNEVNDQSRLTWYNLETLVWTNNFFLHFKDIKLTNWNIANWYDNYDIFKNKTWSSSWKWNISYNNWTNQDVIKFIPKTLWWISWSDANIALYSNLKYNINWFWKEVLLPWVQTWFGSFWPHELWDFISTSPSEYSNESIINFWEIDIRWITQTRNTWWEKNWEWATATNDIFKDVSTITLLDLKTNINKNVETLLSWSDRNLWKNGSNNLSSFNFSSQWWLKLQNNQVIYFKDRDVKIDCSWICDISWKKTIIVENWNIFLASDMKYSDKNSILWIILIWNKDWNKSQFRVSEEITNGVWIVYSEWPILSVNSSNSTVYNWANTSNIDLLNQLYWKWSFATRNTVWWSVKDEKWVCPYWTQDYGKPSCTVETAQWYDLIYVRRYSRVLKSYYWIMWDPMWDWKIPLNIDKKDIKIAWWDTFAKTNWSKTSWSLPKPEKQNLNAPVIVEYDSRIQSNPPLWFNNN